jgi:RNA recognition motif-containing protein
MPPVPANFHEKKLYIRNLDFRTIPDDIRSLFEGFGTILACDLPKDHVRPGYHKG